MNGCRAKPSAFDDDDDDDGARYWCDYCAELINETNESPRFNCAECEGFDACSACHNAHTHPHFMWREVPQQLRSLRDGEQLALSTGELMLATLHNFRDRWGFGTAAEDGARRWATYATIQSRVDSVSCGFRRFLGISARTHLGISGGNSEDWMVTDIACPCVSVNRPSSAAKTKFAKFATKRRLKLLFAQQLCMRGSFK
jgi:hypothetical protein